jgi:hypothetical protein
VVLSMKVIVDGSQTTSSPSLLLSALLPTLNAGSTFAALHSRKVCLQTRDLPVTESVERVHLGGLEGGM